MDFKSSFQIYISSLNFLSILQQVFVIPERNTCSLEVKLNWEIISTSFKWGTYGVAQVERPQLKPSRKRLISCLCRDSNPEVCLLGWGIKCIGFYWWVKSPRQTSWSRLQADVWVWLIVNLFQDPINYGCFNGATLYVPCLDWVLINHIHFHVSVKLFESC